jgi:hypothetical protein
MQVHANICVPVCVQAFYLDTAGAVQLGLDNCKACWARLLCSASRARNRAHASGFRGLVFIIHACCSERGEQVKALGQTLRRTIPPARHPFMGLLLPARGKVVQPRKETTSIPATPSIPAIPMLFLPISESLCLPSLPPPFPLFSFPHIDRCVSSRPGTPPERPATRSWTPSRRAAGARVIA